MKLKDTIGVYNNAFSKEECALLIQQFENAIVEGTTYTGKSGDGESEYKKSNDFNLSINTNTSSGSIVIAQHVFTFSSISSNIRSASNLSKPIYYKVTKLLKYTYHQILACILYEYKAN